MAETASLLRLKPPKLHLNPRRLPLRQGKQQILQLFTHPSGPRTQLSKKYLCSLRVLRRSRHHRPKPIEPRLLKPLVRLGRRVPAQTVELALQHGDGVVVDLVRVRDHVGEGVLGFVVGVGGFDVRDESGARLAGNSARVAA